MCVSVCVFVCVRVIGVRGEGGGGVAAKSTCNPKCNISYRMTYGITRNVS